MKRNVSKVFKYGDYIDVYQTKDNPNLVYKEYFYVTDSFATIDELKQQRKKLMAMKKRKQWPDFLLRPIEVERFKKENFTVQYPFVEGVVLEKYLKTKDIDIRTCAKFIKKLEDLVYKEKDFVFSDLANIGNIIVNGDITNFIIIDPDDVQFDGYETKVISSFISAGFSANNKIMGMKKCQNGEFYNKQLDIRSIYALLYVIMRGYDYFYPPLFERDSISDYEVVLSKFNIPENSSLYRKSMETLDENIENSPISDSIYELIEDGYEFEQCNENGKKYNILKKK